MGIRRVAGLAWNRLLMRVAKFTECTWSLEASFLTLWESRFSLWKASECGCCRWSLRIVFMYEILNDAKVWSSTVLSCFKPAGVQMTGVQMLQRFCLQQFCLVSNLQVSRPHTWSSKHRWAVAGPTVAIHRTRIMISVSISKYCTPQSFRKQGLPHLCVQLKSSSLPLAL